MRLKLKDQLVPAVVRTQHPSTPPHSITSEVQPLKPPFQSLSPPRDLVDGAPEQQYTEQTVTRTREIKTYTGPTMDVKEQLLAYEARFKQQDAVIAQMTEALKKLGADIDPPAAATKKSTKKK